jgi:hypothetical protein
MLSTEIIIRDFAESVIQGIIDAMPHSSGDTSQSFFYRYDGKRLQIGSTKGWITVLEDGRRPGKRPPVDKLEEWVRREIPSTKNPSSLAFAISKKIGEEGSLLYRKGGRSGVLTDYINQDYVHENLTIPIKNEIVSEIVSIIKSNA